MNRLTRDGDRDWVAGQMAMLVKAAVVCSVDLMACVPRLLSAVRRGPPAPRCCTAPEWRRSLRGTREGYLLLERAARELGASTDMARSVADAVVADLIERGKRAVDTSC